MTVLCFFTYQTYFLTEATQVSALVVLNQQYKNSSKYGTLTAARYIFPIPDSAAVCAFKMKATDGRIVTGVVKETKNAMNMFEEAVNNGSWAGITYEITSDGQFKSTRVSTI